MTSLEATHYIRIKVEDKPGMLSQLARGLKWKSISLRGLWGFATGEGQAQLFCVPNDLDALRSFLKEGGYAFEEGRAIYAYGPDETGALVEILEKLAHAGVNIHAIETVAAGNQFASYLWFQGSDEERAFRVLGFLWGKGRGEGAAGSTHGS